MLTVNTSVNFKCQLSGDFLINTYVLRNNISGTQVNASNPYLHQHIVQKMFGGINGISGFIPASPTVNTDYIRVDTITIPLEWNIANIDVVAYIFEKIDGKNNTLNAAKYSYSSGINDVSMNNNSVKIYPIPASNSITVENKMFEKNNVISIYNLQGMLLLEDFLSNEKTEIDISKLARGVYFAKINNLKNSETFKIIKE